MSGRYVARTPPIAKAQAEELGRWLRGYAIHLANLSVYHVRESGEREKAEPLKSAILDTAGVIGAPAALAPVAAPLAIGCAPLIAPLVALLAPLAALLAPWAVPVLIGELVAVPAGGYVTRRNLPPPDGTDPVRYSEIEFGLADVGPARVKWTEYLLSIYGARHAWQALAGMRFPGQWTVGAAYAARPDHPLYPPAWAERKHARRRASGTARRGQPSQSPWWERRI